MLFALGAASSATALVETGKKAWLGYKGAKAAVNTVNRFRRAPEEMGFTFELCATLLEALPVAEGLAMRHLSLRIVGAAVLLARQAVQQCDELIDAEAVEDTVEGWAEWMRAGRKMEALQRVQSRLALSISSLQLALSAVSASSLAPGYALSPFTYVPDAFEQAHARLQQMEMGRVRSIVLCGGELWQRGAGRSNHAMSKIFRCRLRLHRGTRKLGSADDWDDDEDDDEEDEGEESPAASTPDKENSALCLWFRSSGEADDDADEDAEGERVLPLDETVRFRRVWSHELAAELPREHGPAFLEVVGADVLCYEFQPPAAAKTTSKATAGASSPVSRPLVLTFQFDCSARASADHRISAECFEALLFMTIGTCKSASGSSRGSKRLSLATTYDPSAPAPLLAAMAERVGPLIGMPRGASATSVDDAISGLITPVRGLDIK